MTQTVGLMTNTYTFTPQGPVSGVGKGQERGGGQK